MSDRTLVLVDASSYLYRAFHALPQFSSSRGEPTGAVLGVINMLLKLIKDQSPELIGVVFDAPGRTFRDDLFAEYKAHRTPMPDDLRAQVAPVLEVVTALGLPLLRIEGVEADDVIGTLACRAASENCRVVISTGDKDMAQLVNHYITCVNTMTGSILDRAGVKAKFDVYPEQIVDYLALVGDSIDNIPGVPKVGPKTAAKWLNEYSTLDNLIANAAKIDGKVGESLRENLTTLELSRKLATIDRDLKLEVTPASLAPRPPDTERLRELYSRLELKSLLRQISPGEAPAIPEPVRVRPTAAATASVAAPSLPASVPKHYETVITEADLDRWLEVLRAAPLFAFDTETTSLEYMAAQIVGLSFSAEPGHAAYVPVGHDYAGAPDQLDRNLVLEKIKPILEDPTRAKLGHHLKYDAHVLANHGIELKGMRYDSMLESYVLNSTATNHNMDSTAEKYLGVKTIRYEDVAGRGAKQLTFNQVPVDTAAAYSAEDADITLQLHRTLWPQIEAVPQLKRLYEEIEQPLVAVLKQMEEDGVLIDREMLKRQSGELAKRMREIEEQAHKEAGAPFNLDSPRQLQEILFNKLQLPVQSRTSTGQPSTAENVLEELAESYPLPRLIMEYRGFAKLKSTYTDKLPLQIDPRTGRVHTSYHQAVAATGRLSSTDPNLQNIPIRTPEGRRIRQAFLAPPGHVLMAADYSQIELRIMAHLSGDQGLLDAFAQDRDIHQATAAEVFGVAVDQVSHDQRRSAKAINFGLIYGMSAFGLARQLGIDRGAAQRYVDLYFQRYPQVKRFMDQTRTQARDQGYVETVFGRRLYLNYINSPRVQERQYAERSAINAPMQGTAADIIKRAMISAQRWIETDKVPARIIMQVHDELVFEVATDAVDAVREGVRQHMSAAAELRVPLKVEVGVGGNWDEAH
ncbi:MAG TPA: DNA polymerase I [Steroidobacteraceae bacterium]|nr:DNA polymerase I [Steroidobacteraceae bacterium]